MWQIYRGCSDDHYLWLCLHHYLSFANIIADYQKYSESPEGQMQIVIISHYNMTGNGQAQVHRNTIRDV